MLNNAFKQWFHHLFEWSSNMEQLITLFGYALSKNHLLQELFIDFTLVLKNSMKKVEFNVARKTLAGQPLSREFWFPKKDSEKIFLTLVAMGEKGKRIQQWTHTNFMIRLTQHRVNSFLSAWSQQNDMWSFACFQAQTWKSTFIGWEKWKREFHGWGRIELA